MDLKASANRLKIYIPAIFLAIRKKETPLAAKIIAGITIAYALSPIDLVPDFIPVLGYIDDLVILPLLSALAIKLIPLGVMEICISEAKELWREGRPHKWYYAIPVLFLWVLIIAAVIWGCAE